MRKTADLRINETRNSEKFLWGMDFIGRNVSGSSVNVNRSITLIISSDTDSCLQLQMSC